MFVSAVFLGLPVFVESFILFAVGNTEKQHYSCSLRRTALALTVVTNCEMKPLVRTTSRCVCVCVYVCVYIYIYLFIYARARTHTHTHTH